MKSSLKDSVSKSSKGGECYHSSAVLACSLTCPITLTFLSTKCLCFKGGRGRAEHTDEEYCLPSLVFTLVTRKLLWALSQAGTQTVQ